ncbi:glutathione peroxidase [Brachybacterium aquaticum]|uniref:Glutathione peroxidase n=1 Tax=Brachybacterium aquaticum TaxID=1432564 RepID=A0A841AB63_9MICO|nr:glutathione peroxidase [Brachybacterium aquaticum]MBB5832449.1 glutathione peroxidase [Brachybacterium aquaticum]
MEAHVTPKETMDAAGSTLHDFDAPLIGGGTRSLGDFRGHPVLVVNTATQCAFTPQLRGLQELHDRFSPRGFSVLGFPSDQFHQDPGTDEETLETCTQTYSVTFPMFAKTDVNGAGAPPMWKWLCAQKAGVMGGRIAWNFTKFLVGADGMVIRRYAPPVPPSRIARRIEMELGSS